ncbi:uncharacterized membrane protein YcaP (DUF421 family) [Spirosoma lacussanchae]|uniref:DUF421 domain-containing protein n=1 Tax=Spirosoma lacussanchae TaxID=1884249 RepID=UPI00110949E6|nr:YetF domain-containing protein [Spirosoma lacussanchae]
MKKEEIHLADWERIVFGLAPGEFMLEVLIRSLIIYLVFTVVARLLGKRMNGQITQAEVAVMLTLGAIIAPAMQLPDRGVLLGVLALTCVLALQRGINFWGFRNSRVEEIVQGTESALVKDGVMQLDIMAASRISKQQIYSVLRAQNIYNIKQVDRLYLEACGLFSIYTNEHPEPGLSVLPTQFERLQGADWLGVQTRAGDQLRVCQNCGTTVPADQANEPCPACHKTKWVEPIC